MKVSTANIITLIATAGFWSLLIADIATPGEAPQLLEAVRQVLLYVLLSATFYVVGARRILKKTNTYEEGM